MTTRSLTCGAAALGLALAALAACGGDDDDASTSSTTAAVATTSTAPSPSTTPPTTEHAAHEPIVRVGLVDYAFGGLPGSVAVGTELEVVNGSEAELHELVAIHLPDTEQRALADLVALPAEELAALAGVPAMVLLAPPGEEGFAVLGDGTLTEPGRYLIICAVPTGADPKEFLDAAATSDGPPQVAGGPPHFTHGMYAELMVEA